VGNWVCVVLGLTVCVADLFRYLSQKQDKYPTSIKNMMGFISINDREKWVKGFTLIWVNRHKE